MKLKELVKQAKKQGLKPDVSDCINGVETEGTGRFQFYSPSFKDEYCMLRRRINPCPLQDDSNGTELCSCKGSEYRHELTNAESNRWSMWSYK